jgi:hypothetical protein
MIASSMALRNPPFVSLYTLSLTGVAFSGATPYVQQYNLTFQHEFPKGMVATVSYVGALGRHQYIFNGAVNVDLAPPGPGTILPRSNTGGDRPSVNL